MCDSPLPSVSRNRSAAATGRLGPCRIVAIGARVLHIAVGLDDAFCGLDARTLQVADELPGSGPVSLDGSLYNNDLLSAKNGQTLGGAYSGFPALKSEGPITLAS